MQTKSKYKTPRLARARDGKPSPRDRVLLEQLARLEAQGPPDDSGKARPSLRDAIELELPYAPSRRVLVNYYAKLYQVTPNTVDRAIALAKESYALAMRVPKAQQLEEGKAFMRIVQNRALRAGHFSEATAAKKYELELAGATTPGQLSDHEGELNAQVTPDETRAILLARLAARSVSKGTSSPAE